MTDSPKSNKVVLVSKEEESSPISDRFFLVKTAVYARTMQEAIAKARLAEPIEVSLIDTVASHQTVGFAHAGS